MRYRLTAVVLLAPLLTAAPVPGVFAASTSTRCITNAIGFPWTDGILTATDSDVSKTATLTANPTAAVPLYRESRKAPRFIYGDIRLRVFPKTRYSCLLF